MWDWLNLMGWVPEDSCRFCKASSTAAARLQRLLPLPAVPAAPPPSAAVVGCSSTWRRRKRRRRLGMCAGDLRRGQVQGRSPRGLSFKNLMCAGCAPAFFGPGPGLLLPLLLLELRLPYQIVR
jgi:hypothetical protein